jgi:hypothetical protein
MMKPIGIALLAGALLALTATPGLAQYVVSAKSGTVNFTEGTVQLDGRALESSITHYADIKEGSVLSTEDGRAEVLLTPGITLRLGDHASLKMITNRLIDTRVELLGGKAVVEADQIGKDTNVTIVVANAAVSLPKAGIYRFNFEPAQVKVFKGEAAVLSDSEIKLVGAGKTCALGGAEVAVKKFETNDTDELDNWSQRRSELMAMANVSGANSFNAYNAYGGLNGAGSMAGMGMPYMGMPYMGCSGLGLGYMPSFGYAGATWGFLNPFNSYPSYGFWSYNPWYGMNTNIPCSGMFYNPYGFGMWSPSRVVGVVGSPTGGTTGVVHRPGRTPISGPIHGPVSLAQHPMLTLAVNGSHAPGFRAGTSMAHASGSAFSGHGGFAGSGGSGGGSAGGSTAHAAVSSSTGGVAGGAASAGSAGHAGGGGGAGGGHR